MSYKQLIFNPHVRGIDISLDPRGICQPDRLQYKLHPVDGYYINFKSRVTSVTHIHNSELKHYKNVNNDKEVSVSRNCTVMEL